MRKMIIRAVIILAVLFGCYSTAWYFGEYKPYHDLQSEFPEIEDSGVKIYVDEDDFNYSVSVPDFPFWNGNLAITQSEVQYALIVWIKPFGNGYSQGIFFNGYNDLNTQIMLENIDTAKEPEDQPVVNENKEIISMLFEKANGIWELGLE